VRLRRVVLLLAILLLCLGLLTVQTRGAAAGRVADLVSVVVTPFQLALAKAQRGALGLWGAYGEWKATRAENTRLRAEVERLRVEALDVRETVEENRRLRRLLALQERLPLAALAGEVIGRESAGWVRSLTVNRGLGQIVTQTPVIVPEGLVGRVVRVRPGASVVQLLSDPASSVGALVQRTRTPGLVEGDAGGAVRLKFMARDGAGLAPGDLVITSGQGQVFPKGLPIGRVTRVEDRGSALFHYAVLDPAVDLARVEEVLLLTGRSAVDLAGLFHPGG
jgi:rod shape-determining protein MreC